MKTLTIRLTDEDYSLIESNLNKLSHSLGYRINKSALVRDLLKNVAKTKLGLYEAGHISYQELHASQPTKAYKQLIKRNRVYRNV